MNRTLDNQRDALQLYFDAMLREEAMEEELLPESSPAPLAPVMLSPSLLAPPPLPSPPPAAVALTPVPGGVSNTASPLETTTQVTTSTEMVGEQMPAWGQRRFQVMLFTVSGLKLAVPLVELNGVQDIQACRITPMPGHVAWYLGLTSYRGRNVPVVDTALLVLPEDRLSRLKQPAAERLTRVVFIDEGHWGLACDSVAEVVTLEPEAVRWRSDRTRRRWLAGTVIQHMCALIDPVAFAAMLTSGMGDALPAELIDSDP
jgi:purine-binding chemotaxis protein CheW